MCSHAQLLHFTSQFQNVHFLYQNIQKFSELISSAFSYTSPVKTRSEPESVFHSRGNEYGLWLSWCAPDWLIFSQEVEQEALPGHHPSTMLKQRGFWPGAQQDFLCSVVTHIWQGS
jgi:hypothetical protein